jgi:hypothetical protein
LSQPASEMDPTSTATVFFEDGSMATFSHAGAVGFEVIGSEGRLCVFGDAARAHVYSNVDGELREVALPDEPGVEWLPGLAMVADLVGAVRGGGGGSQGDSAAPITRCDVAGAR